MFWTFLIGGFLGLIVFPPIGIGLWIIDLIWLCSTYTIAVGIVCVLLFLWGCFYTIYK